ETPRPLREINPETPEWLQALIAKLHAKNPAKRCASAAEVAAEFSRRLAELQKDGTFSEIEGPARQPRAKMRLAGKLLGAALVVAAVATASWFIYQSWIANRQEVTTDGAPPVAKGEGEQPIVYPVALKPSRPALMQHTGGVRTLAFS